MRATVSTFLRDIRPPLSRVAGRALRSAGRPPHGPHRRPVRQRDLVGYFEAVPKRELLVALACGLEIRRHAVPIARLEHRSHEGRPEPAPLPSRPRAE